MGGQRSSSQTRSSAPVPRLLYHGTTPENEARLLQEGFSPDERQVWGNHFGPGVYLDPSRDHVSRWDQGGRVAVEVDIDPRRVVHLDMSEVLKTDWRTAPSTPEILVREGARVMGVTVPSDSRIQQMIRVPDEWSEYLRSIGLQAIHVVDPGEVSGGEQYVVLDRSLIRSVRKAS